MKSINIQISDREFEKLGLKKNSVSFSEWMEVVLRKVKRDSLKECLKLSKKHGLSEMTLEEINEEIRAARNASTDS